MLLLLCLLLRLLLPLPLLLLLNECSQGLVPGAQRSPNLCMEAAERPLSTPGGGECFGLAGIRHAAFLIHSLKHASEGDVVDSATHVVDSVL